MMTVIISKGLYDELMRVVNTKKPSLVKETELMYINHAKHIIDRPLTEIEIKKIKKHVKNLFEG